MNYKKGLLLISILVCILFMISSVNATNDIETGENQTLIGNENQDILNDVQEDNVLSSSDDEDVLGGATIYFDASASYDGDGSSSRPYKYYDTDKITFGSTVYFKPGVYNVESTLSISSSLNYKTTFIGLQGSQNTILKSSTPILGFKVRDNANFVLQGLTIDGPRINNNGNLDATDVNFKNSNARFSTIYSISNSVNPTVKLTNCVFTDTFASELAGAINVYNGNVDIKNCIFTNTKSNQFGGAIEVRNSNLNIVNSKFNYGESKHGGAVYAYNSDVIMTGSTFDNCKSDSFGGTIAADHSKLTVNKCNFTNYKTTTDGGGAIYSIESTTKVSDSSFINGSAYFGGAICNLHGDINVSSSEFTNNIAEYYGGSIYNMYSTVNIVGNTFDNSRAKSSGGAFITRFATSFTFNSNTFINTYAPEGPVVFVDGDEENIHQENNEIKEVFRLVAVYKGSLNGNEIKVSSNYLTFAVSLNGDYTISQVDETPSANQYIDFSIASGSSSTINTPLNQKNIILFNILKKDSNLINQNVEICLIDEVGNNVSLGVYDLSNINYSNANLFNITFNDYLLKLEYDNMYSTRLHSGVPLLNYTSQTSSGNLPSSYDSRDYGYITPVKDQGTGGNCWAFGGIATLEACLKKATGITFDFSEENVKNLMSEFSQFGWGPNSGGNDWMVWAYLASWLGPVFDQYDAYDEYSALSALYNPVLHIQNILTFPDITQQYVAKEEYRVPIKQAIRDYGAVTMTTTWSGSENHCMSIVGWDDNYVGFDYFGTYTRGAWIVKNSYGPTWQYNGYLYISYYRPINSLYTFVFTPHDVEYSDIYQYDYGGLSSYFGVVNIPTCFKNKFISRSNDILSAVSTYFDVSSDYTIKVYVNGKLNTTQTGYALAGYDIIPLDVEIPLAKGDEFTIEFNCKNSKVPLCRAIYNNKETFNQGLSFLSYDSGNSWTDLFNWSTRSVACIKAFTRPATLEQFELKFTYEYNAVELNTNIPIYVELPKGVVGLVTFTVDGTHYYVEPKDGLAILNISFDKPGTYNVNVHYRSSLRESKDISFNITAATEIPHIITMEADEVIKYYTGEDEFKATLFDNGIPLAGKTVTIKAGPKTFTVKTDSNGKINLNFRLNPGIYTVYTFYGSKVFTTKYTVKSTIGATDFSGEFLKTSVNATFLDSQGRFVDSGTAIFRVNGKDFHGEIDEGIATASIKVNAGNYTITIVNPITGEQLDKKLVITRTDPEFYVSHYQDGNIISIEADLPFRSTGHVTLSYGNVNAYTPINSTSTVNNRGYTILKLNDLSVGTHVLTAYYEGDDNYESAFIQQNFTVEESNVVITAEDASFYYGSSDNIYYVTVENNGHPVDRPVAITINGWTNYPSDNFGRPYIVVKEKPGVYPVQISYGGVTVTKTITVLSTIICNQTLTYDYLNAIMSATFLDVNGNNLKNQRVMYKIGETEYYATTDSEGRISEKLNLNAGMYDLTLVNPVNNEEFHSKIVINKITPHLYYILNENSDSYSVTSILPPSVSGGSLVYTFDGRNYVINYNKGFSNYIIHTNRAGNFNLAIRFTGDVNFNSVSQTATLNLKNKADVITAYDIVAGYGQDNVVSILLQDASGKLKSYSSVAVNVNGAVTYLTTDSQGRASYVVNLNAGSYNVQLTSGNYGNKYIYVVVKKSTPTLKASKKTFKLKKKTKKYTVTFKLPKRNLNHYKLTLKVKGKTYKAYTNSKGKATFKITKLKKKGTFKATIKFAGDGNLNKVSKKVKIKVK